MLEQDGQRPGGGLWEKIDRTLDWMGYGLGEEGMIKVDSASKK